MGCVLLDSGYVFFHNLDAVFFAALEIARFVLGGRNEKVQDCTAAVDHVDSL